MHHIIPSREHNLKLDSCLMVQSDLGFSLDCLFNDLITDSGNFPHL